jgi:hypothetical protein
MRAPISRVRMQRVKPLCASFAITAGAWLNPQRVRSSTEHQPSTAARHLLPPVIADPRQTAWESVQSGLPLRVIRKVGRY